jgi:hypothetical protein
MTEGYRDELEREILARYEAELDEWLRRDRAMYRQQWGVNIGLLGFNAGFLLWNLGQVRQQGSWINGLAVVVHALTLLYMAWKLWPRR